MASEKKRYIVTGVENKPTVTDVKALSYDASTPDNEETGVWNSFGESIDYVQASRVSGDGDFTISARGTVEPARVQQNQTGISAANYYARPCEKQAKLSGEIDLVNAGSLRGSTYVWKPDSRSQYQLRETYNGFQKVNNALVRTYDYNTTQKSYVRPTALALDNGFLLCGYLDNEFLPWHWTYRSNLLQSGSPTATQLQNTPTGFSRFDVFKFHLIDPKDRMATTQRSAVNSMLDNIDLTTEPGTLQINVGFLGVTGFDTVQYKDTGEVLMVYCGFMGVPLNHVSTTYPSYNPAYLCVDQITSDMDYSENWAGSTNLETSNRAKVQINTRDEGLIWRPTTGRPYTTDVPGIENAKYRPLDLCAEVLPSGRLVIVIAYEDAVYSLVSDDRGRTFQASQLMDLTFNDPNFVQRCVSVSSTLLDSGNIALLVTANGIGDRAGKLNEKAVDVTHNTETDPIQQSVVSVFVSGDGVNWGTEKRLGQGAYDPIIMQTDTTYGSPYAWPNDFLAYNSASVFAISGSIVQAPDGNVLVTVIPMSLGGAGNGQQQGIFQRVLSVSELTQGQTGSDVAPAWPPIIDHPDYAIGAKTTNFQPAMRFENNYLDTTFTQYIWRRYVEFSSYGQTTLAAAGAHTNNLLCATPLTTSYYSPMSYGAGPMWSMGPVDVKTVVWRDTVVTVTCTVNELSGPACDFPNSDTIPNNAADTAQITPTTPDMSTVYGLTTTDRTVCVFYSGGWSPAYIRRPTELRWYCRLAQPSGIRTTLYNDNNPSLPSGASLADFSHYLGSNGYQISFFAPQSQEYYGWLHVSDSSNPPAYGSFYSGTFTEDEKIMALGRRFYTTANCGFNYIDYLGQIASAYRELYFPNSRGDMLPAEPNSDRTYLGEDVRGGLAFVCRYVCRVVGGFSNPSTPGVGQAGVSIYLQELDGATKKWKGLTLSIAGLTDGSGYSVAIDPFDHSAGYGSRLGTLQLTSPDNSYGSGSWIYRPNVEVIFGYKRDSNISTSRLYPFLMARLIDNIGDPDMLGEFTVASGMGYLFPLSDSAATNEEYVRVGSFSAPSSDLQMFPQSFQFSRIFLNTQTTDAQVFDDIADIPLGDNYWDESAHIGDSASIEAVKGYNGGVFSPMGPSKATAKYQMLERGAEISVAGRATSSATMKYEGKSSFPVDNIFSSPIMAGFRGSSVKIAAPGGRDVSPPIEITLDFGTDGITAEAFAAFGINSPDFMMQFTDDLSLEPFGAGPTNAKPSFTVLCGNPLGEAYRVNHALLGAPAEGSGGASLSRYTAQPFVYKPRYEHLGINSIMNDAGTGSSSPVSGEFRVKPYFLANGEGRVVRFMLREPATARKKDAAPFRPHQFRSTDKESFYLQVIKSTSYAADRAWQCLNDPLRRMTARNHIFKIKDNGHDWVELTSDWDLTYDADTLSSSIIYSDRFGFNLPRGGFGDGETYGSYYSTHGNVPYRYVRITLAGGVYHDPDESFVKLNALLMGQRIELSTRDVDAGYSYEIDFGNELYTGLSGARRSRKNSEPRKSYTFSYTPRPAAPFRINQNFTQNSSESLRALGYENPYRGYGELYDDYENSEQEQERSLLSWQEIVERVLRLGVNGDVCALVFDGDGMVMNNLNTLNPIAAGATVTKAASDPHSMIPARLTGYGGGGHEAYFGKTELKTDGSGTSAIDTNSTEIRPRAIMSIKSLKFEEEL